jgi:hypothetical protein
MTPRRRALLSFLAALILPAALWASLGSGGRAPAPTTTFADAGDRAVATLIHVFYAGHGLWNECDAGCGRSNQDWGVDSLTYALYLRWATTHDRSIVAIMRALISTAPRYAGPCPGLPYSGWSDVPEWDSIAASRAYEVTGHDSRALAKSEAAFAFVENAKVYELGACPQSRYQQPGGGANQLKTLETDGNAIKAALLLYRATRSAAYLDSAIRHYAAVRRRFLDSQVPLYSVYVVDDGRTCTQLRHRFFASVNGDLIWSGLELARDTGAQHYLRESIATAKGVVRYLSDPNGVFADLQAENDIVEPLIEAMYGLATEGHASFARSWIIRNAAAALSARAPDGAFGRFFDGPAPRTTTTAWQTNGGLALMIAAAALDPRRRVSTANRWGGAHYIAATVNATPASVTFSGSAIAFLGTLGEVCCESGHARVLVDGRETFDGTGVWQNKSSSGRRLPNTVLFAWRWPKPGTHTISFEPGEPNPKEGGSFLRLKGYVLR